eukprot:840144-Pyramimonas_sp.AAC.1
MRGKQYKDGEVAAKPGEHYIVVTPDTDEYFVFPHDAGVFCHSWVFGQEGEAGRGCHRRLADAQ